MNRIWNESRNIALTIYGISSSRCVNFMLRFCGSAKISLAPVSLFNRCLKSKARMSVIKVCCFFFKSAVNRIKWASSALCVVLPMLSFSVNWWFVFANCLSSSQRPVYTSSMHNSMPGRWQRFSKRVSTSFIAFIFASSDPSMAWISLRTCFISSLVWMRSIKCKPMN